jgi:hypothetical protein
MWNNNMSDESKTLGMNNVHKNMGIRRVLKNGEK